MSEEDKYIDVHGFKLRVENKDSQTLKNAVRHLKDKLHKDEAKVFFDAARHDRVHNKAHVQVHNSERGGREDNVTLFHHSDGTYSIDKRKHY